MSARPTTRISVRGVTKGFVRRGGARVLAVDDIQLDVKAGEFLVLLGPSGCGKTTLLRVLAGLELVESGQVYLDGILVEDALTGVRLAPEHRNLSMMFQSYALWPHKTVFGNVEYPLVAKKVSRGERRRRVREALSAVGIGDLESHHPARLSGGQQQRVALARALVGGEGVVLFDEPLSNVDAKVREALRTEITRLHREFGFTAVYVTHDQEEAMTLATRVVVLRGGKISQSGPPREIYESPVNSYVARFMGSANEMSGVLVNADADEVSAETPLGTIHGHLGAESLVADSSVIAFIRPEKVCVGEEAPSEAVNVWTPTVSGIRFLGSYTDVSLTIGDSILLSRVLGTSELRTGQKVKAWVAPSDVRFLEEDGSTAALGCRRVDPEDETATVRS